MTTTTTALQALVKACDDVLAYIQVSVSPADAMAFETTLQDARAALSAPPAAQDAPAGAIENGRCHIQRLEECDFSCQAGSLRMSADWQQLIACFEWLAEWAARASQPATPAAATVLVPPAGAGASPRAVPISELQQHAAEAAAIVSKLYNDTPDVSTAVQAGAWMQRAAQYLAATPAAHPVAGQGHAVLLPIPEQLRQVEAPANGTPEAFAAAVKAHARHAAYMAEIDHGDASEFALHNLDITVDAMAAALRAAPTAPQAPQAPALVPLTGADRMKLLQRAGFAGLLMEIRASGALSAHGDTDLIDRVDMAIADFESAGITPATKEQSK